MERTGKNQTKLKKLTGIALFTAIVAVLQLLGTPLKLGPFAGAVVLVPIAIGAAVYGVGAGAWLGFVFGVIVLLSGDAAAFLAISIPGTIVTVLLKGTLAGLCSGLLYRLLEKINVWLAGIAAAVICPVVNSGVFLLGCRFFFFDTIIQWAGGSGYAGHPVQYMFLGLIGVNFLVELGISVLCTPLIVRMIKAGKKI